MTFTKRDPFPTRRRTNRNNRVIVDVIKPAYKQKQPRITVIDKEHNLTLSQITIHDQGSIICVCCNREGDMLATVSTLGNVKLWKIPKDVNEDWHLLQTLRDSDESAIEEFYCGTWLESKDGGVLFAAAGKRKYRHVWCDLDDDNQVLPGVIKIFDLSADLVIKLEGHKEEILFLKAIEYEEHNYLLSCGQDGYTFCWKFSSNWRAFLNSTEFSDGETCMAFSIEPIPGSRNRYLLGACDDKLKIFDMETMSVIKSWPTGYSSYCDHALFVDQFYLDPSIYENNGKSWCIVARGVELLDMETFQQMSPNSIKIFQLKLNGDNFHLTEISSLHSELYQANSWLLRLSVSGSMVLIPTVNGKVLCIDLNLVTESQSIEDCTTAILHHHGSVEVRGTLLHESRPILFTFADDGIVKIYHQLYH